MDLSLNYSASSRTTMQKFSVKMFVDSNEVSQTAEMTPLLRHLSLWQPLTPLKKTPLLREWMLIKPMILKDLI